MVQYKIEKKEVDNIITAIKNHFGLRQTKDLAQHLDISPSAIGLWRHRGTIPNYVHRMYLDIKSGTIKPNFKEEKNMPELAEVGYSGKLIELQDEKIKQLEIDVKRLKEQINRKESESIHWNALQFHFQTEVKIHVTTHLFGRTILDVTNIEEQSKYLGYSPEEIESFYDLNTRHDKLNSHPIESILSQETIKKVRKASITLPSIFDSLKHMVGNHYIPMPLIYKHKDGHKIPAISYNKVDWFNLKVYSKIEFLDTDNN